MYRLEITITNPVTREDRTVRRQFDEANMTLAKWNSLGQEVKTRVDELVASAAASTDFPVL